MNRPIRNLAVFCMLLFCALLVNVTWLQYGQAGSLSNLSLHPDNQRVLDAQFSTDRGSILVHGNAIAQSVKSHDRYVYKRVYPKAREYANITGYYTRSYGLGGLEASQNSILSGTDSSLFINNVLNIFGGNEQKGGNVLLTINPAAQDAAYQGLRKLGPNVQGAVVALEPATGRILAMVSSPTFNPNRLASHDFTRAAKYKERLLERKPSPLNNKTIQAPLPPGSTFKTVTASAALRHGFTPTTLVPGGSALTLPQTTHQLHNENGVSCGGSQISFTQALDVSCNVAFGWTGLKVGARALANQARAYGFGQRYFTDLDDSLVRQDVSVFPHGLNEPETALSAIGQYDVAATPLQMAMIAAAIANNGTVMKPYLVDETQAPDLETLTKTDTRVLCSNAISAKVAGELTNMMVSVVDHGTGTSAQIPGVAVAGKTGTAQSTPSRPPYAWFVSFAPAHNARVAVAVLVQDAGVQRDQISGNGLAAPIAKSVMEAVLR